MLEFARNVWYYIEMIWPKCTNICIFSGNNRPFSWKSALVLFSIFVRHPTQTQKMRWILFEFRVWNCPFNSVVFTICAIKSPWTPAGFMFFIRKSRLAQRNFLFYSEIQINCEYFYNFIFDYIQLVQLRLPQVLKYLTQ